MGQDNAEFVFPKRDSTDLFDLLEGLFLGCAVEKDEFVPGIVKIHNDRRKDILPLGKLRQVMGDRHILVGIVPDILDIFQNVFQPRKLEPLKIKGDIFLPLFDGRDVDQKFGQIKGDDGQYGDEEKKIEPAIFL